MIIGCRAYNASDDNTAAPKKITAKVKVMPLSMAPAASVDFLNERHQPVSAKLHTIGRNIMPDDEVEDPRIILDG